MMEHLWLRGDELREGGKWGGWGQATGMGENGVGKGKIQSWSGEICPEKCSGVRRCQPEGCSLPQLPGLTWFCRNLPFSAQKPFCCGCRRTRSLLAYILAQRSILNTPLRVPCAGVGRFACRGRFVSQPRLLTISNNFSSIVVLETIH